MDKHIKLPKEGLIEPEEKRRTFVDDGDVEGHGIGGIPTTAPPAFGANRSPGHGGEAIPMPDDADDVEGHRFKRG